MVLPPRLWPLRSLVIDKVALLLCHHRTPHRQREHSINAEPKCTGAVVGFGQGPSRYIRCEGHGLRVAPPQTRPRRTVPGHFSATAFPLRTPLPVGARHRWAYGSRAHSLALLARSKRGRGAESGLQQQRHTCVLHTHRHKEHRTGTPSPCLLPPASCLLPPAPRTGVHRRRLQRHPAVLRRLLVHLRACDGGRAGIWCAFLATPCPAGLAPSSSLRPGSRLPAPCPRLLPPASCPRLLPPASCLPPPAPGPRPPAPRPPPRRSLQNSDLPHQEAENDVKIVI